MTLAIQAKILRLLQDGRFERVGGNEMIETDVQIIAATNQNLEELVAKGRFREDLYYRLKVFAIHLPPLRQRMEDLPLLVQHFTKLFSHQLHKPIPSMPPDTMELLKAYDWPGNVRELQSAIKYAFVQETGGVLAADWLPENVRRGQVGRVPPPRADFPPGCVNVAELAYRLMSSQSDDVYRDVHAEVDRILLDEVLRHTDGNQVLASQILGISRTTLRSKLAALGKMSNGED